MERISKENCCLDLADSPAEKSLAGTYGHNANPVDSILRNQRGLSVSDFYLSTIPEGERQPPIEAGEMYK